MGVRVYFKVSSACVCSCARVCVCVCERERERERERVFWMRRMWVCPGCLRGVTERELKLGISLFYKDCGVGSVKTCLNNN